VHELAEILDHVPSVVSLWDADLHNRFTNWACLDWFGKRPRDLIGTHLRDLLGKELYESNRAELGRVLAGEPQVFERTVVTATGPPRYAHIEYTPYAPDGVVSGYLALATDVTAHVRAEASGRDIATRIALIGERERIAADMEEAVIGRLTAMCHELREPDVVSPSIRGVVSSAAQLVDATLIELRSSIYNHRRIGEPNELAGAVLGVLGTASRSLGFVPTFVLDGSLDRVNAAVGAELVAVLFEALSNTARHADADAVEVTIRTVGDEILLTVADDGRGIAGPERHSGLGNMNARAVRLGGTCSWLPNEPSGTVVEWRVPADRRAAASGPALPGHARRATDIVAVEVAPVSKPERQPDTVRLSEAELLDVLDILPVVVTVWTTGLRNQFANRAGLKWFGKTERADILGRHIAELLTPEMYETNLPFAQRALDGAPQLFERTFTDPDGVIHHTRVTYSARVADGEVVGLFVEVSDVTGRVEAEARLRDSTEQITVLQDRQRIAEDLHDLVIQHLFAAGLKLHSARELGGEGDAARIESAIATVDAAIADLRQSIVSLNESSG
jgi:PAS domain S-box-containing protein